MHCARRCLPPHDACGLVRCHRHSARKNDMPRPCGTRHVMAPLYLGDGRRTQQLCSEAEVQPAHHEGRIAVAGLLQRRPGHQMFGAEGHRPVRVDVPGGVDARHGADAALAGVLSACVGARLVVVDRIAGGLAPQRFPPRFTVSLEVGENVNVGAAVTRFTGPKNVAQLK